MRVVHGSNYKSLPQRKAVGAASVFAISLPALWLWRVSKLRASRQSRIPTYPPLPMQPPPHHPFHLSLSASLN